MGASEPTIGPLAWYQMNTDVMVFCLVVSFISSGIAIFLKNARGSSVAVSLLSSLLFVSLGVPYMSINYHWAWTSLATFSMIAGFGSLTLAWTLLRIATMLQGKAETGLAAVADSYIRARTGGDGSSAAPLAMPPTLGATPTQETPQ